MRWLELIEDGDCIVNCHRGEVNVFADALSIKERVNVMSLPKELIKEMENLEFEIKDSEHREGRIYEMLVRPELLERIKKESRIDDWKKTI